MRDSAGELAYEVRGEQSVTLPAEDVVHIKGPSGDGSEGYRLVQLARESLGFTLAAERFGASFFGNAARPSGVLETAGQLSEAARENLRKSWAAMYQGVDRVGAVPVLEEGMTFKPFSVTNEEGQYTETRQHQVYEVCRWIGVDPIFVYEYGRATWNNAEAQTRNFLQFSLNPWLRRWESELSRKCVLPSERAEYFPEFVREAVVQMDTKTQHEVWGMGVDKGWYTVDEVRRWLNLPPRPEPKKEADGASITAD